MIPELLGEYVPEGTGLRLADAARAVGVTRHEIRHYEAQGWISPPRDERGHRRYTAADIVQIRNLQAIIHRPDKVGLILALIREVHRLREESGATL